jgi:hypothetical protein
MAASALLSQKFTCFRNYSCAQEWRSEDECADRTDRFDDFGWRNMLFGPFHLAIICGPQV